MVRFWQMCHDLVKGVYYSFFSWLMYLDQIIHGHIRGSLHTSFEKEEEEDPFIMIQNKRMKIDNDYQRVIKQLSEEEEFLRSNRDQIIHSQNQDLYQLRMQNIRKSKERVHQCFKQAYTKLSIERDYLIQREVDKVVLLDRGVINEENFEDAFIKRRSDEQYQEVYINHLSALIEEGIEEKEPSTNEKEENIRKEKKAVCLQ